VKSGRLAEVGVGQKNRCCPIRLIRNSAIAEEAHCLSSPTSRNPCHLAAAGPAPAHGRARRRRMLGTSIAAGSAPRSIGPSRSTVVAGARDRQGAGPRHVAVTAISSTFLFFAARRGVRSKADANLAAGTGASAARTDRHQWCRATMTTYGRLRWPAHCDPLARVHARMDESINAGRCGFRSCGRRGGRSP